MLGRARVEVARRDQILPLLQRARDALAARPVYRPGHGLQRVGGGVDRQCCIHCGRVRAKPAAARRNSQHQRDVSTLHPGSAYPSCSIVVWSRKVRDSIHLPVTRTGCIIVGEVADAPDGSLGLAHAFIDAIARAGADAVKFQTHIAAAESTPAEPWRIKFSKQDETRYDYWKRMEFSESQWRGLAEHAAERGLLFLSSPFSMEAVELLERLNVPAWKIG